MSKIDQKVDKVYEYLKNYRKANGYPPSVREICAALTIKSTATAYYYLEKLEERGLLSKNANKNRALTLTDKDEPDFFAVPLVGTVTAGVPILAVENLEGYYPLPTEFESGEEMFMLRVSGTSMIEAGILDGDKVICEKTQTADNGDIVVALIDDSATVKRFYKKADRIILHPENSALSDIVLPDVAILGKVTGLMRKF